jgi:methionyl-tRNA synthetase
MKEFKRYTITAALPYANGPVHIGHLAGCYLPADIYARYLRSIGKDIAFVCGSDEHGVAITLKAMQEGVTPQQLVDKYHGMIKNAFEEFGISFDIYSRTSAPEHHQTASDFFTVLHDKGVFEKRTSRQYYDVQYKQFLADRYIFGECPNCHNPNAYGDQCEKCGTSLDPSDLINPKSRLSGETPELRETEHWFLPLQNYETWLKTWILEEHKDWKTNVLGQCKSWLTQGLHERSITRDMDWGVKVPLPGAEGKVLYVWLDAPIGYITATKQWAARENKDWKPYWQDVDTRLIHFIGKDNIVFHCIIFPVMLKAHGDFILPDNVPANEFLNIEGDKVSTSRNWAVWLHEYLVDFPGKQDVLRYVLCSNAPETKDNDFLWKDFQAKNNNELAAILGNLVNRVLVLTRKYYESHVPPAGLNQETEVLLGLEVKNYPGKIAVLLEDFKFREALSELMNLARLGNKYLTDGEPWKLIKTDPERTATVMHFSIQLLANIAILCEPFLPGTSSRLKSILGLGNLQWKEAGRLDILTENATIGEPVILFEKIEDDAIEKQVEKLLRSKVNTQTILEQSGKEKVKEEEEVNPVSPFKSNISFDEFSKLDLRIATVEAAEKVPDTQKLMKLSINLGSEKRTVVSGIAEHFSPEDIVGRQVCLVANLEPRKIKGIMSQGMILMIEDADKKLVFLKPDREVPPGTEAR